MSGGYGDTAPGRIEFRADDEALTPYAGLACVGELERQTDSSSSSTLRAAPVKRRRRGVSGAELVVSLAESQLVGGECFDHIEDLRADAAAAPLRAVAGCRRRRPRCSSQSASGARSAGRSSAGSGALATVSTARSGAIRKSRSRSTSTPR